MDNVHTMGSVNQASSAFQEIKRPHSVECGLFIVTPPHDHGDLFFREPATADYCGSPPRVWGIRTTPVIEQNGVRFTPTCVGNTMQTTLRWGYPSVHPHVCGEYAVNDVYKAALIGSPPRVWGIRLVPSRSSTANRFTPTCVGNTSVN